MNIINKKYHSLGSLSDSFRRAKPFPHIALDNFLDPEFFETLVNVFNEYSPDNSSGISFRTEAEKNKWISLNAEIPKEITAIIDHLNKVDWISNLLDLTGLDSINATPHGNTKLANYHEMKPGGFLAPHVDHSQELETGMPHVLNNLVYLSPEWDPDWGGATLLYDRWGEKVIKKIDYKPNRAIIFLHTPYSFHCVERLNLDNIHLRRSIYVDYYSDSFSPYNGFDLDFPNKWFKHGTTFKLNSFMDYLKCSNRHYSKALLQYMIRKMLS